MKDPSDSIAFPPDFPPTSGWNKFFLGVRWIGPDLSFFKEFRDNQSQRTRELMNEWNDDELRNLALEFGKALKRHLQWKSYYFLPSDILGAVLTGPKFGVIDGDLDAKNAVEDFQEFVRVSLPKFFWEDHLDESLLSVLTEVKNHRLQT